jgi:hypothetical protein
VIDPRPCPSCQRPIDQAWVACPYCALDLSTGRPIPAGPPVLWEGVVPRGASFPAWPCLFCAGREHVKVWEKDFTNFEMGSIILLVVVAAALCLPLIVLPLVMLGLRKVQRVTVPRCEPCRDRMTTAKIGGEVASGAAVLLLPAGLGGLAYLTMGMDRIWLGALGGLAAACLVVALVRLKWIARRVAGVKRIAAEAVTLRVPDPAATREALRQMTAPPPSN